MKNLLVKLVFLLGFSTPVIACDICGTGSGTSYFGFLPDFQKKFIGLRYKSNCLHRINNQVSSSEKFRSLELWGAINLGNKFRIAAFLPYNLMERTGPGSSSKKSGMGDASIMGYYRAGFKSLGSFKHSLWLGGGLKLPSGKYDPNEKNLVESAQNTFQLGTGSLDYSLNLVYNAGFQNLGFNSNINYWMNSTNNQNYKFGNRFNANLLVFYKIKFGAGLSVIPNAGVMLEKSAVDQLAGQNIAITAGHSKMAIAGLEFNTRKISAGINFHAPLFHHAEMGRVQADEKLMCHLSFAL